MMLNAGRPVRHMNHFLALFTSHYGGMLLSICFSFTLARFFGPAAFGRVEVGLIIFDIANWLTEWGWDHGLMTAPQANFFRTASTHLWLRIMSAGFLCTLLGMLELPIVRKFLAISHFTHEHRLILIVLAVGYVAEKISLTYKTVLERTYQLSRLSWWELAAVFISYVCAFIGIWLGLGALSIAVQRASERIVLLIGYFTSSPWKGGMSFEWPVIRTMFKKFGWATWLSSFVSLVLYERVASFVGYFAGAYQAGIYARALRMGTFPLMITAIMGRMTAPLYSLNAGNRQSLRNLFIKSHVIKFLLVVPVQIFLFIAAPYWIPFLLGPQWKPLVSVYRICSIYGLVRSFYDDVPALLLYGYADRWVMLRQHLVQASVVVVLLYHASILYGAIGSSFVMTGSMIVATGVLWATVRYHLQFTRKDFRRAALSLLYHAREFLVGMGSRYITRRNV